MKQITIRIDDEQFNELQYLAQTYRMNGISSLIRRAIDVYIMTFPECKDYIQYFKERRNYEHDEYFQKNRQSSFQKNSSKHQKM